LGGVAAAPVRVTVYLTVEQVLDFHQRLAGGGPVLDLAVITAAVMRPQLGFGGHDAHPTMQEKAAALLHGLASTQGFEDGNKRTAWIATVTFLELNGVEVPEVPVIDAEVLVCAVAVSAWTDRTVSKAAEWLEEHTKAAPGAMVGWLRQHDAVLDDLGHALLGATGSAGAAGDALAADPSSARTAEALEAVAIRAEGFVAVISRGFSLPPMPDPETERHFRLALARWGDAAEDLRQAAAQGDSVAVRRSAAELEGGTDEFYRAAAALRRATGQPPDPQNPHT
jgi:prophage maintenance system killer protein